MSTATRNPFFINPKLCSHLTDYKCVNDYNTLKRYIKTSPNGRTRVVRHSSEQPRCIFCSLDSSRLYLCLICDSISCFEHALLHSQMNEGHDLAVDVQRSEIYCCACNDQVYDPDFDKVVMRIHIFNSNMSSSNGSGGRSEVRLSKRRKLSLIGLDFGAMGSVKDRREKSCFPLGLRGLNNLGNTCFMNSVLQALLHTPPLRNYFLSNRHNRLTCRTRSMDRICLPCDIDKLFSAVFSGDRTPYSPAQFLYSWWQHSANLATYEQQDAHEFFISMLDLIHEKDNKERNLSKDNGDCPCIAHRVFSGLLRSDVTCTTCGFTSTTYDPCVDISLDLDIAPSSKDGAKKTTKPSEHTSMSTLAGCLDLFTRPEKLGSDQKLYCQNCRERRDSVKQMSIRRLPLVLCLHIKRFEHSHIRKMSRKIDRYMQFPFSLDMSPYLSSSIVSNRFGNRMFPFEGDETETSTEYEVFAVVTHSGMLESGHYVSYLRLRNQWYKCDDAWITEVDEAIVRASQCYLVYYVQKVLYNKANEDFSCFPLSPRGDSFVPIAGCC